MGVRVGEQLAVVNCPYSSQNEFDVEKRNFSAVLMQFCALTPRRCKFVPNLRRPRSANKPPHDSRSTPRRVTEVKECREVVENTPPYADWHAVSLHTTRT